MLSLQDFYKLQSEYFRHKKQDVFQCYVSIYKSQFSLTEPGDALLTQPKEKEILLVAHVTETEITTIVLPGRMYHLLRF